MEVFNGKKGIDKMEYHDQRLSCTRTWKLYFTRGRPRFARNIILLLLSMMFLNDVIIWSLFICEEHD